MKSYCSKTNVFKHCEIDSGVCMNRIHPVDFVLKSEENSLLSQILSKMELVINLSRVFQRLDKSVK